MRHFWIVFPFAIILLATSSCAARRKTSPAPEPNLQREWKTVSSQTYSKPPRDVLEKQLSPLQYRVTQDDATEPAFRNAFWDHHEAGLYVDVVSGEPLFSSTDKFDSGTGWPSFVRPVEPNRVVDRADTSYGMRRVEVRSAAADSHLGHVFEDGPAPTGLRYCMNSASIDLQPKDPT